MNALLSIKPEFVEKYSLAKSVLSSENPLFERMFPVSLCTPHHLFAVLLVSLRWRIYCRRLLGNFGKKQRILPGYQKAFSSIIFRGKRMQ